MRTRFLYKNFYLILFCDLVILAGSLFLANLIRYDFSIPYFARVLMMRAFPLVLVVKIVMFFIFDLYNGMWRYTGIADLINVLKAASLSTLVILSLFLFSNRFEGFSRAVFFMDWCMTLLLIAGLRLCVRFFFEKLADEKLVPAMGQLLRNAFKHKGRDGKRLIIIGAGNCGEILLRELSSNPQLGYRVVGFLDDKTVKVGKKIHGVPVLNIIEHLEIAAEKVQADEIIIAIPSATASQMRRIVEICKASSLPFKTVPSYGELLNGNVSMGAVRDVSFRDLIGRETLGLETERIGEYLKGKSVLVTGAGGSIGSELCRQICRFHPGQIILYENAETPLYEIDRELKGGFPDVAVVPFLGDVRSRWQLASAFGTYAPDVVFHAAAYKHVPMLEAHPWRAVENNIEGTRNVVETARAFEVDRFVFVSTDKAVRPVNVMGATKRFSEVLVQNQNRDTGVKTRFMIVRFGNVVGSSGSVVPLFREQIRKGGPVTVTHPDVTRYFMTIPEAAQLIIQAGAMGTGGEIFILDMGEPVKIVSIAEELIRLNGLTPSVDIEIEYIGLRPGEKVHEALTTPDEGMESTRHEKILVLGGRERSLVKLNGSIKRLKVCAEAYDREGIIEELMRVIPEYHPDEGAYGNEAGSPAGGTLP